MRCVAASISASLGVLALVLSLTGCATRTGISARLHDDISQLEKIPEINKLADFGDLGAPSPDIRSTFTSAGSVYRVIDASEDRALIAVWKVSLPKGQSVEDPREFTASACASLERKGVTVTSTVVDCPHPLVDFAPSTKSGSWARDAAPIELAVLSAQQLNDDIRWLMFRVDGGGYRGGEAVDISDVAQTIDSADLSAATGSVNVTTTSLKQHDNHVTGAVTITASAQDETDTQSQAKATVCFALDVDLAARATGEYDNWMPVTEIPC